MGKPLGQRCFVGSVSSLGAASLLRRTRPRLRGSCGPAGDPSCGTVSLNHCRCQRLQGEVPRTLQDPSYRHPAPMWGNDHLELGGCYMGHKYGSPKSGSKALPFTSAVVQVIGIGLEATKAIGAIDWDANACDLTVIGGRCHADEIHSLSMFKFYFSAMFQ